MNDLEKVEYINVLFDIYKNLLTEKQKDIMERYYTYNLSLKEISEDLNISRSAAFDTIEHASKKLYDFVSKLKIHKKRMKNQGGSRSFTLNSPFFMYYQMPSEALIASIFASAALSASANSSTLFTLECTSI